jgi:hypothetical protein
VTAGLSAAGGVVGALTAVSAVSALFLVSGHIEILLAGGPPRLLGVAAAFGAFCGLVGGPLLGWGLLRRVPLGRALVWTAAGTIVGAVSGESLRAVLSWSGPIVPGVMLGGFLGFVIAGIGLRVHAHLTEPRSRDAAV